MNIKQKMIAAMWKVYDHGDCNMSDVLTAALSIAADPANRTEEMRAAIATANAIGADEFTAGVDHIKGLPT